MPKRASGREARRYGGTLSGPGDFFRGARASLLSPATVWGGADRVKLIAVVRGRGPWNSRVCCAVKCAVFFCWEGWEGWEGGLRGGREQSVFDTPVKTLERRLGCLASWRTTIDQSVTSVLVRGGGGFRSLTSRIAVSMCVVSSEYVCSTSAYVFRTGMSRASVLILRWYLETSLRFHRAHRASGTCRVLHGMVCTTIGLWSWIPVTLEKSGTEAAVDLKKEINVLDP